MNRLLQRIADNKSGFALALAAVLLVGAWRAWALAHRPTRWQAIAAETGSVPQLGQNLLVNHGNTHLVFSQQMETTLGFYLCDIATRKVDLLSESLPEFYGWSPDDTRLAFKATIRDAPGLVICDGKTGRRIAELQHPGFESAKMFAWLSGSAFAYVAGSSLGVVEQKPDGSWSRPRMVPGVAAARVSCFTGVSATAVAWKDGNTIQWLELGSESPVTIWQSPTNTLQEFVYSPLSSEFLLQCSEGRGQYLLRYSPRSGRTEATGRIDPAYPGVFRGQSHWRDDSPAFLSWRAGWPEAVYLSDDGLNTFFFASNTIPQAGRLDWCGGVTVHTPLNGDHLYITGQPTNQPPGVWDYDLATGSLNCLVPGLDHPFKQARYVTPSYGRLTNASGELRGYSVWEPAALSPGKKYPLILGQTVNGELLPYQQMAANCGWYFALVHRPYWLSKRIADWPAEVTRLYEVLASNPNVDTNRVFLWGRSAETSFQCQLFREKSPLWKGLILFDPGGMPDLASLSQKKLFIITGKNGDQAAMLLKFQDQALAAGIAAKLYLQENTGHYPPAIRSVRERTEVFARFLVEDL